MTFKHSFRTVGKSREEPSVPQSHLRADEIPVFIAVHLAVLLKQAVLGTCAHEVEVALAGGEAAADGGARLAAAVAALNKQETTPAFISCSPVVTRRVFEGLAYQVAPPGDSAVHLQEGTAVLVHLCGPEAAVDVGPLVLAQVQQPPRLLRYSKKKDIKKKMSDASFIEPKRFRSSWLDDYKPAAPSLRTAGTECTVADPRSWSLGEHQIHL